MEVEEAVAALRLGLDRTALFAQTLPFWALVVGHSLTALDATRGITDFWLVSWLLGFLAAYGGGSLSALLLQSPASAAVALLSKNSLGVCYTLTWWAFCYFPGRLVARAYDRLLPLRCAAKLARAVLRATTVVHRVNAAVKLHPGVVAAPILLGTLAGAGGKLLTDAFLHCAGYRQGPTELAYPGYALRSAALGALLQYLLVHVGGLLTSQQGLGLVMSLYVAHSLATDITGTPCDYTAPLGWLFHKITLIPEPTKPAASKPSKEATKAAQGTTAAAVATPMPAKASPAPSEAGKQSGKQLNGEQENGKNGAATPGQRVTRRRAAAASTRH